MRTITIQPHFESWRYAARQLLAQKTKPDELYWVDDETDRSLFADEIVQTHPQNVPKVSAEFLDMARSAAAHTDPRRWALLYKLLWRHTHGGEKWILEMATDPELRLARSWCKAVGRDIHKMHAFVRFQLVSTHEVTKRESFVAWFEPDHRIVRLATPFFEKRFHNMDWSILTPWECAHWNGDELFFTPGLAKNLSYHGDTLDKLWLTYYRNIFNPARLKVNAMQSEMPKKYWKNLPEASLIPELIAESKQRMRTMLETELRPVKSAPKNAYLDSLRKMNAEQEAEKNQNSTS